MISEDWFRNIHERLLSSDPIAPAELAEKVFDLLVVALEKKYPKLKDTNFLSDAATDALMSYIKRPSQFDPSKRGLFGYLEMSADGDLKNALAKEKRRRGHEISYENVELLEFDGNKIIEKEGLDSTDIEEEIFLENINIHNAIDKIFNKPKDQEMAKLVLRGERSTQVFAKVLGLKNETTIEKRRQVKRHKDRIKKRLERHLKSEFKQA